MVRVEGFGCHLRSDSRGDGRRDRRRGPYRDIKRVVYGYYRLSPREFDELDLADLHDLLDAFKAAHPQPGPQPMSKGQRDRAIGELYERAQRKQVGHE